MGAWIEINNADQVAHSYWVAPHMGAWIEIAMSQTLTGALKVAPHMGAWIEIDRSVEVWALPKSHPTWVRGLK